MGSGETFLLCSAGENKMPPPKGLSWSAGGDAQKLLICLAKFEEYKVNGGERWRKNQGYLAAESRCGASPTMPALR